MDYQRVGARGFSQQPLHNGSGANPNRKTMKKTKTAAAAPVSNDTRSAATPAPAAGIKKFNLAGIAKAAPAGKPVKTYPVLPDEDGHVAELVDAIIEKAEQLEALEGAL